MIKFFKKKLYEFLGPHLIHEINIFRKHQEKIKCGNFARNDIDKILHRLMPYQNGFYVELGAHDGALASNSYFFELKKNWRGILIEPCPNLFLKCLKRRGKKNFIYHNACVAFDYKEKFVCMKYSDSATISDNLDLDVHDREQHISKIPNMEKIFLFGAESATLNSLLEKSCAPSLIDFLSLDVEGAELDVLKGINFSQYNFRYIVVECRSIQRLQDYLEYFKYKLIKKLSSYDYLFALNK
jgi:FkbM family methyltransferase